MFGSNGMIIRTPPNHNIHPGAEIKCQVLGCNVPIEKKAPLKKEKSQQKKRRRINKDLNKCLFVSR